MSRNWEPHLDYSGEPMRPGQFRDPPESWAMSEVWTGRSAHAGTPLALLRWRLYGLLYPSFECELCVGQAQGIRALLLLRLEWGSGAWPRRWPDPRVAAFCGLALVQD